MPSAALHSTTSYGPVQPLMSLIGGVRYNSTKSPGANRFSPDKANFGPQSSLDTRCTCGCEHRLQCKFTDASVITLIKTGLARYRRKASWLSSHHYLVGCNSSYMCQCVTHKDAIDYWQVMMESWCQCLLLWLEIPWHALRVLISLLCVRCIWHVGLFPLPYKIYTHAFQPCFCTGWCKSSFTVCD